MLGGCDVVWGMNPPHPPVFGMFIMYAILFLICKVVSLPRTLILRQYSRMKRYLIRQREKKMKE